MEVRDTEHMDRLTDLQTILVMNSLDIAKGLFNLWIIL